MNKHSTCEDGLIFGYTWNEIKAAQQGARLEKRPPAKKETDSILLKGDVELLEQYGLKKLEKFGYFGIIDRLTRAGLVPDEYKNI
jgi:hypothetical protein